MVTVFLGLGSNVGDRRGHIETALAGLAAVPGIDVVSVSQLIETEPVSGPPQGRFLNGAARLEVGLEAVALLAVCKQLERQAGRDLLAAPNTERPLDLDLLVFGDERIDTRTLVVPHPRMFERDFVLTPLAQLTDVDALRLRLRQCASAREGTVIREPEAFAARNTAWLRGDCTVGLVPTMGALHAGHASLVRTARAECDRVAATIFVNPLQFAPHEDLDAYPRSLDHDLDLLAEIGVDAVFVPDPKGFYPEGFASRIAVGEAAQTMEGASRLTHFVGVTTVVAKLFNLARPSRAYFGQKDAQQLAVLRRMVRDLDYPLELRVCPIVREPDGLAMSSRNAYLTPEDRVAATALSRALTAARDAHRDGERDADRLLAAARAVLDSEPRVRVDYLELRTEGSLAPLPPGPVGTGRMLVAGSLGSADTKVTRLIDNMSVTDDPLETLATVPLVEGD